MPKKLNIKDIETKFKEEGYTLLTKEYLNNKQLLEYICPNGHTHSINWGRFQQGERCPYCSGRYTHFNEIEKEFIKRGYNLLTTNSEYQGNKQLLVYICPNGHKHKINWSNFKRGHGCPECAGQFLSFENIIKEFTSRGCKLLTKEEDYKNNTTELIYECENGHIHKTNWATFRNSKNGCMKMFCDIAFVKKFFESKGCKLLTKKYENNSQELTYVCPKGKEHKTTWRRFFNKNQLCKCFKVYKGEEKISELLMLNKVDFKEQYSFKDCKYKGNLKFDFYLPSLNVCIEYDGVGHFKPTNFNGIDDERAIRGFEKQKLHDDIKDNYCKENNITLLRIPYWEINNIEDILTQTLIL